MVSKKEPDGLPPGWKLQTKVKNGRKYKYYIELKTHRKFYSKASMLRYIKDGAVNTEKFQNKNEHTKKTSGKKQMQLVQASDYEWLPTGWVVERRLRKSGDRVGTEYKCFIDPLTGSKFFSKPEVLRYLENKQHNSGLSRGKDKETTGHSSSEKSVYSPNAEQSNVEAKVSQISKTRVRKSPSSGKLKVVIEKTVDEELPSGWIKETRIKMLGDKVVRRDRFFADPASRWVFCSKLDVLRYLETGEVSRHAYQRRNGKIAGEDLAVTTSSSKKEDATKDGNRNKLFAGEGSSKQSIEASPPNAGVHEKSCGKKSRASFRVQPPPRDASTPNKTTLYLEPSSGSQEKAEANKPLGMTKYTPPTVEDVDAKDASLTNSEPSSLPSKNIFPVDSSLDTVDDYNDKRVQTIKRKKMKDGDTPRMPSRSSKRLAGVGAEVVFLPIPIEHVLRGPNKKPSRSKPSRSIPSLGSVPDEKQEKHQDGDRNSLNEGALKATSRRKSSRTKPFPSLESVPKELLENSKDANKPNCNEGVIQATSRRKSSRSELIPCSKSAADGFHETQQDVNKDIELTTQGKPLSMGTNDLNFQEETHHTIDGDMKDGLDIQVDQPLSKFDGNLTSFGVQRRRLDQEDSKTVLPSHGESFYVIEKFPSEEVKHHTPNFDTNTLLVTHEELSNKIDDLTTKRPVLVDLNDLQLEVPPGFPGNTKVGESTTTMTSSKGRSPPEEQFTSTEKQIEQPQSDLCFTAPLWSDPCLEFAYKTLTGAIPFDDNLAIQDYIQHQLRTSDQGPDICAPSFLRNDEPKGSTLPEDINFLNTNSLGPQEVKQVKNK